MTIRSTVAIIIQAHIKFLSRITSNKAYGYKYGFIMLPIVMGVAVIGNLNLIMSVVNNQ